MALHAPAKAATVSCKAIDATSIVSGNIPSGACTNFVQFGDIFELDFSDVFADNGGSLPLDKFYSLQVANLNTVPSNTLAFSNVEFLVSGQQGGTPFTDQAITIWTNSTTESTPIFPFAQGLGSYSTSGTSNTFGGTDVQSQASFTLTGPVAPPSALGIAALINTTAVNLQTAGITSFTGAKIRGTFSGSSSNFSGFSAGLALFDSDPNMGMVTPSTVYGNAFNAVPGPLPIVGAGAAFGWSRRLRRRVKKASTVASVA
ncbi:hypothetical protein [Synechococcus sp. CBW1004]|uniref:hypothetical protein n=1 Tax=Synechococcus sp. CBW1004 TaxID=1353136 RepID=UPI0018CE3AB1|nr:hypothetical protein [Synechococcus sp. CBW1004]QPN63196.1 hypothetical protein H8F25_16625 [Synechococcus sp. CBW1004]